jgi:hypothetical protein
LKWEIHQTKIGEVHRCTSCFCDWWKIPAYTRWIANLTQLSIDMHKLYLRKTKFRKTSNWKQIQAIPNCLVHLPKGTNKLMKSFIGSIFQDCIPFHLRSFIFNEAIQTKNHICAACFNGSE